ncbi:MAG: PAS domain S-box protein [Nitrospira sp.]|nr:PAS domain S-box protein [Nitrospira sp.]
MESVPESIFFVDRDSRIVSLNAVAQQLVGRTRNVVGQGFHDLVGCLTSDENEVSQCPFNRMVHTGEPIVIPSHFWKREDGTQFELSLLFWPRTQQGMRVGGVVVVHDLTMSWRFSVMSNEPHGLPRMRQIPSWNLTLRVLYSTPTLACSM